MSKKPIQNKVICKCIDCIEKNPQGWAVLPKTYKIHCKKYEIAHKINTRLGAISLESSTIETETNIEETIR